ncbi:anthranilate synthase family protein [Actinomyces minihominis]|uniref:anthranilate synthase family protein n=1 Tax=Actinomyces minihominis TaxID=2002838 RepID=UPI000C086C93|nr:chorismate-binding protein [Actinomyces minihominis]
MNKDSFAYTLDRAGRTADSALPNEVKYLLRDDCADPVAIVRRQDSDTALVLTGEVEAASLLADIPLEGGDVLALIPYHQIRERGWEAQQGPEKLLYLRVSERWEVPLTALTDLLPSEPPVTEDIGFMMTDEAYAEEVGAIIRDEIGRGEGANFVIRRDYLAHTEAPVRSTVLSWLRQLLVHEAGAYWTFVWVGAGVACAGASPERHVSAEDGTVLMNPISGTFRHQPEDPTVTSLLEFLADRKESEELVMVVDEELKMMSAACPEGGVMRGPYLKPMTRVTHTEYLLEGKSSLDPREILRLTMFAPTVIGSPMESACRVIARHETSPRGYYSGVLALFEEGPTGYRMDAPILLRTAFITEEGDITVSAGATLVRHSDPASEAQETRAKASGMLTALGLLPRSLGGKPGTPSSSPTAGMVNLPEVQQALQLRNRDLAPFWRDEQTAEHMFDGRALLVDCGDDFTQMLAHQLRHLGLEAVIVPWFELTGNEDVDLVIFGPGPGDPTDEADPRVVRVGDLIAQRVESEKPTVAVCFSHQILALRAGLPLETLKHSRQGLPLRVSILGKEGLIGFYNTFAAVAPNGSKTPGLGLEVESDPESQVVAALVGKHVVGVQGHLESVLSYDGFTTLERVVAHVLG